MSGSVYLVPGPETTCVVVTDPNGREFSEACAPNAIAASEGLFVIAQCEDVMNTGVSRVGGVVPDDLDAVALRRNGRTLDEIRPGDNGYALQAEDVDEIVLGSDAKTISKRIHPPDC